MKYVPLPDEITFKVRDAAVACLKEAGLDREIILEVWPDYSREIFAIAKGLHEVGYVLEKGEDDPLGDLEIVIEFSPGTSTSRLKKALKKCRELEDALRALEPEDKARSPYLSNFLEPDLNPFEPPSPYQKTLGTLPDLAIDLEKAIAAPGRRRGPKGFSDHNEIVEELAIAVFEATEKWPSLKHSREPDRYYGPFRDLLEAVTPPAKRRTPEASGDGKWITRAIERAREDYEKDCGT